jgi:hypothetical protein
MTDMKKSKFTEEQIIGFLRQAEAGIPIKEVCRNGGFSDVTNCHREAQTVIARNEAIHGGAQSWIATLRSQ